MNHLRHLRDLPCRWKTPAEPAPRMPTGGSVRYGTDRLAQSGAYGNRASGCGRSKPPLPSTSPAMPIQPAVTRRRPARFRHGDFRAKILRLAQAIVLPIGDHRAQASTSGIQCAGRRSQHTPAALVSVLVRGSSGNVDFGNHWRWCCGGCCGGGVAGRRMAATRRCARTGTLTETVFNLHQRR